MSNLEIFLIIAVLVALAWCSALTYFIFHLKTRVDNAVPKDLDYKLDLLVRATAKHEMFIDDVKSKAAELETRRRIKVR